MQRWARRIGLDSSVTYGRRLVASLMISIFIVHCGNHSNLWGHSGLWLSTLGWMRRGQCPAEAATLRHHQLVCHSLTYLGAMLQPEPVVASRHGESSKCFEGRSCPFVRFKDAERIDLAPSHRRLDLTHRPRLAEVTLHSRIVGGLEQEKSRSARVEVTWTAERGPTEGY